MKIAKLIIGLLILLISTDCFQLRKETKKEISLARIEERESDNPQFWGDQVTIRKETVIQPAPLITQSVYEVDTITSTLKQEHAQQLLVESKK